jgi:microcystin synthetase protein McyA
VEWSYSAAVHEEETIRSLGERYLEVLAELIEHCRSAEAGGFTPSDFPLARVSQEQLNNLLVEVDFDG